MWSLHTTAKPQTRTTSFAAPKVAYWGLVFEFRIRVVVISGSGRLPIWLFGCNATYELICNGAR